VTREEQKRDPEQQVSLGRGGNRRPNRRRGHKNGEGEKGRNIKTCTANLKNGSMPGNAGGRRRSESPRGKSN